MPRQLGEASVRVRTWTTAVILATAVCAVPLGAQNSVAQNPPVRAGLLVDVSAGQVLAATNPEVRFLPASVTKAMTALIAFDMIAAGKLNEDAEVVVPSALVAEWSGKGTRLNLSAGDRVRVAELLMGITTASANDAAMLLAQIGAGSSAAWVALMNARATGLGMANTRFATPNGWPDGGATYTTAADLVRLGEALATTHPDLYHRYVGQSTYTWRGQRFYNHDPFAGRVPGADGIKTGFHRAAGYNFLGTVQRQGRRLMVVIAGARSEEERARDATRLIEWGFSAWDSRPLVRAGQIVGRAQVQNGNAGWVSLTVPRAFAVAVPHGTNPPVSAQIVYAGPVPAPLRVGQQVGWLEVAIAGQPRHRLPLIAATAVGQARWFDRIGNALLEPFR